MLSHFSLVRLFAILWTIAHQAPWSMIFSSQEYWIGFPFHSPGDLPDQGIEPGSPILQADFFFFLMWNFKKKSLLSLLQYCFYYICVCVCVCIYIYIYMYIYIYFWPEGVCDLSSLTRDWTCTPCDGSKVLTTGPPGKFLADEFFTIWATREARVLGFQVLQISRRHADGDIYPWSQVEPFTYCCCKSWKHLDGRQRDTQQGGRRCASWTPSQRAGMTPNTTKGLLVHSLPKLTASGVKCVQGWSV